MHTLERRERKKKKINNPDINLHWKNLTLKCSQNASCYMSHLGAPGNAITMANRGRQSSKNKVQSPRGHTDAPRRTVKASQAFC